MSTKIENPLVTIRFIYYLKVKLSIFFTLKIIYERERIRARAGTYFHILMYLKEQEHFEYVILDFFFNYKLVFSCSLHLYPTAETSEGVSA